MDDEHLVTAKTLFNLIIQKVMTLYSNSLFEDLVHGFYQFQDEFSNQEGTPPEIWEKIYEKEHLCAGPTLEIGDDPEIKDNKRIWTAYSGHYYRDDDIIGDVIEFANKLSIGGEKLLDIIKILKISPAKCVKNIIANKVGLSTFENGYSMIIYFVQDLVTGKIKLEDSENYIDKIKEFDELLKDKNITIDWYEECLEKQ